MVYIREYKMPYFNNVYKLGLEIKNHHVTPDYEDKKKNHMSLFDKNKILQNNFKSN